MTNADAQDFAASNRALWNEWAEIHAGSSWYDLNAVRSGADKLRPYEIDEVGPVNGRTLLHLQCQIGTDTIAWARRGATVTGVDFSPRAVEIASKLAAESGVSPRFVCSDVLELPGALGGTFDVRADCSGVWLGVPRHTFSAVFGAVIALGLDYRETLLTWPRR